MADGLTTGFPFIIAALALAVLVLAVRLDRRMSRGAHSAGPYEPIRPVPPGQTRTPWELTALDQQLTATGRPGGSAVGRYDIGATVNRLITASGLDDLTHQLPLTADQAQLAAAIAKIEDQLGLPPFDSSKGENGRASSSTPGIERHDPR